ncbi:MAG: thioesterase family protein [Perlucidibaca sp.]
MSAPDTVARPRGPASLAELGAAYPYIYPLKVNWGDMDALGHVNNVMYFQYLENSRIAIMEWLEVFPRLFEEGTGLVIADARCRYKAPVVYPDTLHIGIRAEIDARDRIIFHYALFSEAQQRIAAEAETLTVAISPQTGRPVEMPDWFRERLQKVVR